MKDPRAVVADACVVGVFGTLNGAEQVVHTLHHAGFPQNQVSLVLWHPKENFESLEKLKVGNEPANDSATSAGLGGVLGFLGGIVVSEVTGLGTMFLIGPIGALFAGAAVGSLVGAIAGLGVRHTHIKHYEECVKEGKVLVIAHGNADELDDADRIFRESQSGEVHRHAQSVPTNSKTSPMADK
jgi:hypothetical protein